MAIPNRPKILFVTRYLPALNGGGTQQRAQTILEALAAIGDVHVFLHDFDTDPEAPVTLDAPFRPWVKTVCRAATLGNALGLWKSQVTPSLVAKALRLAWVTTGRLNPATPAQNKAIVDGIRAQTQIRQFDIVFARQAHCAMLVTDALGDLLSPEGTSILDWDAAEAIAIRESTRQLPFWQSPLRHFQGWWNAVKLRPLEARLLRSWDAALCASPIDVEYFKSRTSGKAVYCLANAVSIPPPAAAGKDFRQSSAPQVVFVASLNYWPNHQGAMLFLNEIWPQVRSALPNAAVRFVGRGPAAELVACNGRDGIDVVGEVDSVAPYYGAADVAIAPMIFSVGSAIKVLEALAYRKPLVGFDVSTSRHGLKDGEHVVVARTPQAFAEKLIALLNDASERERLATKGHEYVITQFSRPRVVEGLKTFLTNL